MSEIELKIFTLILTAALYPVLGYFNAKLNTVSEEVKKIQGYLRGKNGGDV